jgi:excinuclease UvrABC helicase subunit UvrB
VYSEFKQFFPNNAVEVFFVSITIITNAQAFMPVTGVFIEKTYLLMKKNWRKCD